MKRSSPLHEPGSVNRAIKHAASGNRPPTNRPDAPSRCIRLACLTPDSRVFRTLAETLEHQELPWEFTAYSHLNKILSWMDQSPPDVVLLDFSAPAWTAFQRAQKLRAACPEARLIGFSDEEHAGTVLPSLLLGAHGGVILPTQPEVLQAVVERVLGGGFGFCPRFQTFLGTTLRHWGLSLATRDGLSPREQEVLGHLCQPMRNTDIARTLGISEATVQVHVKHLLKKLHVSNRAEAARSVLREFWPPTAL